MKLEDILLKIEEHLRSKDQFSVVSDGLSKLGRLTPLTIILAFVLLTEVVCVVGVVTTSATAQLILATFCALFPPFMAIPFFYILYNKPLVFYAPDDYGEKPSVQAFAAAIAPQTVVRVADSMSDYLGNLEKEITKAIAKVGKIDHFIQDKQTSEDKKANQTPTSIGRVIAEEISKSSLVKFELAEIGGKTIGIPADNTLRVNDILDTVFIEITKTFYIPPYSYNRNWVLEDSKTGKRLDKIGTLWAKQHGMKEDARKISEAGLNPGDVFKIRIL